MKTATTSSSSSAAASSSSSTLVFPAAATSSQTPLMDYEHRTNEVVQLLSTTLRALAADAAAVRQATSLAHCVGVFGDDDDDDDDEQPQSAQTQWQSQLPFRNQLVHLDQLVTGMEDKVTALRQMVHEETRALEAMETTLYQEAQEQAYQVAQLAQAMEEADLLPAALQDHRRHRHHHDHKNKENVVWKEGEEEEDVSVPSNNDSSSGTTRTKSRATKKSSRTGGSRRDSVDPRAVADKDEYTSDDNDNDNDTDNASDNAPQSVSRITQAELNAYKAQNVMGPRISLITLNEVLEEIQTVCHRQRKAIHALRHKTNTATSADHNATALSSSALQRRYDYLHRRHQHSATTTPRTIASTSLDIAGGGGGGGGGDDDISFLSMSITEQELREKCAFFRHGESTARSTLAVLCRLKRLKQMPSKNRQVVYFLLGTN